MADDETTVADMPTGQTLALRSLQRDHPGRTLDHCPRCGTNLMRVGITELAYVFDRCDCPAAGYVHLVEQLWHRTCHAAEAGELAVAVIDAADELIADAKREALAAAHKAILAEANRGAAAIPARQHVTYPGGLRRAARIVDGLLGRVLVRSTKEASDV